IIMKRRTYATYLLMVCHADVLTLPLPRDGDVLLAARLNSVSARDDLRASRLNSVSARDDLRGARLNFVLFLALFWVLFLFLVSCFFFCFFFLLSLRLPVVSPTPVLCFS
ncbi:hypothetical protein AMECASPLE_006872, partial [Ameca splendens]